MDGVTALCEAVMQGVANALRGRITDLDAAIAIMREEVKAFLNPDDPRYAAERDCVRLRSLHDGYIIADIVSRCIERIMAA